MSSKRKVFVKSDLSIPTIEHQIIEGKPVVSPNILPPQNTIITFPPEVGRWRTFDFSKWYGVGLDAITYACQRQIERFFAKQDGDLAALTVVSCCKLGAAFFLDYLVLLSSSLRRDLTLADINREIMDGYLAFLRSDGTSLVTSKARYGCTKTLLKALCSRGLVLEVRDGDNSTFPDNPFPGVWRQSKGAKPLSRAQRKAFTLAVRNAVAPLFSEGVELTGYLVGCALLVVALHTGRNTTPLLEMPPDCLRPHPKLDRTFLVLFKRRGRRISKVALRDTHAESKESEAMPTLRPTVAQLIRRVVALSESLRKKAPRHLKNRVWLYRAKTTGRVKRIANEIVALTDGTLALAIKTLVRRYDLKDENGKPLHITVSRLRKTFVNRVYELLEGDVASTAAAAGNSVPVAAISYLRPGEDSQKNWKFLGLALTNELLTNTLGATERTPVGRCSDVFNGEYAPKRDNVICTNFLDCLRCRNYVVTGDDLYRLFSFYWRILSERARMDPRRWRKQFAHIVRLIDRDVIQAGLKRGVFKRIDVDRERERARQDPHPFWRSEAIIREVEELSA